MWVTGRGTCRTELNMEWFTSGVINAITECRQNSSLLVVYVKDLSEASQSTNKSWEDQSVQEVLSGNVYVALQLMKDSVEFNQFSQLFPVFVLPTVFCISPNGDQLSVFSGSADAKQLVITLTQAFQRLEGTGTSSSEEVDSPEEQTDKRRTETTTATTDTTDTTGGLEEDEEQKQEQIKKYREKMAQKRIEKEEEQEQKKKSNELRRRREGREVGDWKKDQNDRERQNLIKERLKEKTEQERARQEVLTKLQQDKLERQSRQDYKSTPTASDPPTIPTVFSAVRSSSSCRIQVKLPGARSIVLTFEPSETVGDLRSKIAENFNVDAEKVILTCVYPRKELELDLDGTSLDQHGLVPSGVVMARTKGKSVDSAVKEGAGIFSLVYSLIQFTLQLLVSLKNSVTGWFSGGTQQQQSPGDRQPEGSSRIRRVKADDDSDDPNNTYNGNSTQQL